MRWVLILVFLLVVGSSCFAEPNVAEARETVASYFAEVDRHEHALEQINWILGDSPRNIEIVVALARHAAYRGSGTEFYVDLALFASKAHYASEEFLILADAGRHDTGERRALLFGARLLAAESVEECAEIMREYWLR
jgi:hypothetical protein